MAKKWVVGILLILVVGFAAWHFHSSSKDDSDSAPSGHSGGRRGGLTGPMPVVAATAKKADMLQTLDALGNVTPLATVTITPQVSGVLQALPFKEGQEVQAGDVLAQIDPRPFELAEQQARGQLERDTALWRDATKTLARFQAEIKTTAISQQQLDDQQSLVDQYAGAMHTDQAAVDTAKLNQVYCRITAPVTGRLGLRQVDVGNYIQAGLAGGLVVLTQEQPIDVLYTLPEDNLAAVMKSIKDGATPETDAFDRSRSNQLATGKLVAVDNKVDPTTGTFKLRSEFENKDESLFPQQFVNVRLLVSTLHDATVIPSAAVLRGAKGTYVYLIKTGIPPKPADGDKTGNDGAGKKHQDDKADGGDKTPGADKTPEKPAEKPDTPDDSGKPGHPKHSGLYVTARPVTVVQTQGDSSAISTGIEVGDRVVVDGADKLKEGSEITLPDPNASAAPAGSKPGTDPLAAPANPASADPAQPGAAPSGQVPSDKTPPDNAPSGKTPADQGQSSPAPQDQGDASQRHHGHHHHHDDNGNADQSPASTGQPAVPAPAPAPAP